MKSLGNIDLGQNALLNPSLQAVANFPDVPVVGEFIFKDQRVLICIEIDNGLPVWVPMTAQLNTHVHDQGVAATTWTIDHSLNSASAVVTVIGTDGKHIIPDEITNNYNQTVITFNENQAGRAVLMMGQEEGYPRANYSYTQEFAAASTSWVVTHALGYNPIIRVFVGNQEVQPLSIVHDNLNQTTVTFSTAQTGYVRAI